MFADVLVTDVLELRWSAGKGSSDLVCAIVDGEKVADAEPKTHPGIWSPKGIPLVVEREER